MHHIHLGVARGEEEHGIQRRHVHALRQATHVAEDAAGVDRGFFLEPVELGFLLAGIHTAIDVIGLADQARGFVDILGFLIGLHH
ncbi:hypothetical protein D9M68_963260 [compost metagenome]